MGTNNAVIIPVLIVNGPNFIWYYGQPAPEFVAIDLNISIWMKEPNQ